MRIPRWRRAWRNHRLLYPLSPTSRFGYRRGRPGLARLTWPRITRSSATVASCCWPGVKTKGINFPLPSTRTWILVLSPPRPRPKASAFGELFLPPPHVDEHAQLNHPQNGFPSSTRRADRPSSEARSTGEPTRPPYANAESGCKRWPISRSALANPARAHPFAQSTASHSPSSDGRAQVVRCSVFPAVASFSAAPTVRRLVHVVCPCSEYTRSLHEFAYRP